MGLTRLIRRLIRLTMTQRLFWSTEERNCQWLSSPEERTLNDAESQMVTFKLYKGWWLPNDRVSRLPTITLYVVTEEKGEEPESTELFSISPIPEDAESVLSQGPVYRIAFAFAECVCALADSRKEKKPEVLDPSVISALYEASPALHAAEELVRQMEKERWWGT